MAILCIYMALKYWIIMLIDHCTMFYSQTMRIIVHTSGWHVQATAKPQLTWPSAPWSMAARWLASLGFVVCLCGNLSLGVWSLWCTSNLFKAGEEERERGMREMFKLWIWEVSLSFLFLPTQGDCNWLMGDWVSRQLSYYHLPHVLSTIE